MGVVVCRHCERVVETFPSFKVTTFYAICSSDCLEQESGRNEKSESA
nr:GapA-binding peptide SR1P [Aquibacillus albus]